MRDSAAGVSEATEAGLETRVVAFFDLLGFKNVIRQMHGDSSLLQLVTDALTLLREVSGFVGSGNSYGRLRMTAFSDCAVISADLGSELLVAETVVDLSVRLLGAGQIGLLTRGGMAHGTLFHEDDVVFGGGLISAYDIEQTAALYPRVVVSESVKVALETQTACVAESGLLKRGQDGLCYLAPFWHERLTSGAHLMGVRRLLVGHLQTEGSRDEAHYGRLGKLRWLAREFNDHLKFVGIDSVHPVDLDSPSH